MGKSHGHCKNGKRSPTYQSWRMMKERCNRPKHPKSKYYGGRGIKVCKRWDKFKNFLKDMGERPEHMSLDRIDPDKNYSKENCKWSCIIEQNHNRNFDRHYLCDCNEDYSYSDDISDGVNL